MLRKRDTPLTFAAFYWRESFHDEKIEEWVLLSVGTEDKVKKFVNEFIRVTKGQKRIKVFRLVEDNKFCLNP